MAMNPSTITDWSKTCSSSIICSYPHPSASQTEFDCSPMAVQQIWSPLDTCLSSPAKIRKKKTDDCSKPVHGRLCSHGNGLGNTPLTFILGRFGSPKLPLTGGLVRHPLLNFSPSRQAKVSSSGPVPFSCISSRLLCIDNVMIDDGMYIRRSANVTLKTSFSASWF